MRNLRERAIDALFDALDSKPMRFLCANTHAICLGLSLLMAAFYFGFVARQSDPGATVLGSVAGVTFVALAVFICWLKYRESHPGVARNGPPLPIPAPSHNWPPPHNWPAPSGLGSDALKRTGDGRLVLPEPPGPRPLGNLEPSPDWPERR